MEEELSRAEEGGEAERGGVTGSGQRQRLAEGEMIYGCRSCRHSCL